MRSVGRLAVLLAFVTAVLVACGDGDDGGGAGGNAEQAPEATTATSDASGSGATTAPSTTAAPAASAVPSTASTGDTGVTGGSDLDVPAVLLTLDELPASGQLATTWNTIGGAEAAPEMFMLLGCGPAVEPPGQPVVDFGNVQFARDLDVTTDQDAQELVTVTQRAWELTDASRALDVVRSEIEACPEVTMSDSERVLRRQIVELESVGDGVEALLVQNSASGGGLGDAQSFEVWAKRGDVVTSVETFTAAAVSERQAIQPLVDAVVARLAEDPSGAS